MESGCVEKGQTCSVHGEPLHLWCYQCCKMVCTSCQAEEHNAHRVVNARTAILEGQQRIQHYTSVYLRHSEDENNLLIDSIFQLAKVGSLRHQVQQIYYDDATSADPVGVLTRANILEKMVSELDISIDEENLHEHGIPASCNKLIYCKSLHLHSDEPNSTFPISNNIQSNNENNISDPIDMLHDGQEKIPDHLVSNSSSETLQSLKYDHSLSSCNSIMLESNSEAQLDSYPPSSDASNFDLNLPSLDARLFPLRCCVYSSDGRRAALKWEDGRLHMYALSNYLLEDSHFMVQISVVEALTSLDRPEVFMELSIAGRRIGRIYFRLLGHIRRARHFMALCLGTLGPNYRSTGLYKVLDKDKPGECIVFGPYLATEGGHRTAGVMGELEWGHEYSQPKKEGLLTEHCEGDSNRDGLFGICTKGDPETRFGCPFGEVISGMEVLKEVVGSNQLKKTIITEVGIAIPYLSH